MADQAKESAAADPGLPVSCECGHVQFRTPSSTPDGMAHCHCTNCQKQSASAFGTSLYFPTDKVFPLPAALEQKLAVFTHPTDSGNTMHCYFCPRCGVRMLHACILPDGLRRDKVSFKAGTVDAGCLDWRAMKPKHIFTRSAVVELLPEWECYETYPPAAVPSGATAGGEEGTKEDGVKKGEEPV
ncbi:Mss4-like protein [Podospora appendiculata]|uniref:Mss4-like protein n=1 Tax=Podospora appendiculata TaxID=314037 RepID=A0AAE0X988_9PEZI|nr:Mss4-like protein [Podospora appendiculata]